MLEKESGVGQHQTGHNSGVIHSGIYYAPGSFRAELCRNGAGRRRVLPDHACPTMSAASCWSRPTPPNAAHGQLYQRARENKVEAERLDAAELRRREPNIIGVGALFVPSTGIVGLQADLRARWRGDLQARRRDRLGDAEVARIEERGEHVTVTAGGREWKARHLIVCGGLQSDRLARHGGPRGGFQIVPFRGEYYRLPPPRRSSAR